jgi:zinc/manganese transport system substrate-binding protein
MRPGIIRIRFFIGCLALGACAAAPAAAADRTLLIVAAENFYGDVASRLAGPAVRVVSVLQNPDADPHLFEPDTSTARLVADADILIYNGLNYDPWMQRLLTNAGRHARRTLQVAALMQRQAAGNNPHLWYDPQTMAVLAGALAAELTRLDPAGSPQYAARLAAFQRSLQPVAAQIAQLHQRYAGVPITATEPVANDLTAAIGLTMYNGAFQLAIMNDTEPGPRETARFEQSLRSHAVRLLIYNLQTSGGVVEHMREIAEQAGIPRVGVTETEPVGTSYAQWMLATVQALGGALGGARP